MVGIDFCIADNKKEAAELINSREKTSLKKHF